ncbi:MAG TPA: site-specific integrase [Acidobacteriaceae bacterium]|jgi:integrase|nr:site-specific integrase [Acidobacteriaceae bacterium]
MALRSRKITLMWHAKTPQGWRYFPALFQKTHGTTQPRHGWVKHHGQEVEYPNGRYFLRSYEDGRKVYREVKSCHPRDAMIAVQSAQRRANQEGAARNPLRYIESAAATYVRDLHQRKKHEMEEKARHVLEEFQEICRKAGIIHTISITRQHILNYHKDQRTKGSSERTIADKHQRVKAWLKFCKIDTSFMPPEPTYERKEVTVYTPAQIKAVRAAADPYMRMVIDLALKLGLREREIVHAEYEDVDWHHSTFRVQGKVRRDWKFAPKDAEQRDIPIPADLLQSLADWKEAHPRTVLIVGNAEDQPEGHLLRKLKTLVRKAGLNCGKCEGCQRKGSTAECERWFLHRFRATYLTKIVRKMDLQSARKYAGHSDIQTTQIYLEAAKASSPETQAAINEIVWE